MDKSSQFMFITRAREAEAALTHLITRLIWYDYIIGAHILGPSDFGAITILAGPFCRAARVPGCASARLLSTFPSDRRSNKA